MEKRIAIVSAAVFALSGAASATTTWNGGDGYWNDPNMWNPNVPGWETAQITSGTVTIDTAAIAAILRTAFNDGDTCVLVLDDPNYSLHVEKAASSALLILGYATNSTATFNHSAGVVTADRTDTAFGETRLAYTASSQAIYNLSGTGLLDTQVLRRGDKAYDGQFNATGGTLVVRAKIYKFGLVSAGYGFDQGSCLFAPGGLAQVGAVAVGDSSNDTDYDMTGGILEIDIASASSFDVVTQYGNLDLGGATLKVNFLSSYVPDLFTTWDIWTVTGDSYTGTGSFGSLPENFTASWESSNTVLRLTYIPEPATLSVLGLGLGALLIRRRRS